MTRLSNSLLPAMLIYKDFITGDEMLSDSYDLKVIDEVLFEVDGKMISVSGGIDESLIGGNASAEGGDEGADDGTAQVIDIVVANRLQEIPFDKKSYTTYIKGYMKKVKSHLEETNPERVEVFMKNATTVVKRLLGQFKDLQFFVGESMDPEGTIVLMNYREDGMTPYFMYWIDGLKEEKV